MINNGIITSQSPWISRPCSAPLMLGSPGHSAVHRGLGEEEHVPRAWGPRGGENGHETWEKWGNTWDSHGLPRNS